MKALLTAKPVTRISIADKPPLMGGQITEIGQDEFEKRFGIKCGEGIYVEETSLQGFLAQAQESVTSRLGAEHFKKQIPAVINDPFAHVVIAFMDDKVGYGLFAKHPIKKGTVVCIYSGEMGSSLDRKSLKGLEFAYYNADFCYKQTLYRGVASFIQHMPIEPKLPDAKTMSQVLAMIGQNVSEEALMLDTELYCLEFASPAARRNLATENIEQEYLIYNGVPVIAMVACKDIEAGSGLGTKYGYQYFDFHPEFFDLTGAILSHRLYQRTYGRLFFKGCVTYSGDFTPLIEQIKTNSVLKIKTNKGLKEFSAEEVRQALIDACAIQGIPSASLLVSQWKTTDIHQALRRAAQEGTDKDIETLLSSSKEIDINARDTNPAKGYTALHLAVMKSNESNVRCLLKHGANIQIQDVTGKTAMQYAASEEMHNLLLGNDADKKKVNHEKCK